VSEPYTIRLFVLEGDPDGVKIVDHLNCTGVGIAFPRSAWPRIAERREFASPGIYVPSRVAEGTVDELPTVYVGQGDEIRTRIESHIVNKDSWDWGYAFVSKGVALNRAHTTWLEHALVHRATDAAAGRLAAKILAAGSAAEARRMLPGQTRPD